MVNFMPRSTFTNTQITTHHTQESSVQKPDPEKRKAEIDISFGHISKTKKENDNTEHIYTIKSRCLELAEKPSIKKMINSHSCKTLELIIKLYKLDAPYGTPDKDKLQFAISKFVDNLKIIDTTNSTPEQWNNPHIKTWVKELPTEIKQFIQYAPNLKMLSSPEEVNTGRMAYDEHSDTVYEIAQTPNIQQRKQIVDDFQKMLHFAKGHGTEEVEALIKSCTYEMVFSALHSYKSKQDAKIDPTKKFVLDLENIVLINEDPEKWAHTEILEWKNALPEALKIFVKPAPTLSHSEYSTISLSVSLKDSAITISGDTSDDLDA